VPPSSTTTSKPSRYLAALVVLILVMLAGVLGSNIANPGHWHKSFKVGLGLDLSSGTQITLQALAPKGKAPSAAALNESVKIMTNRVEGTGLTGATVVPQSPNQIVVSVPGQDAQQVSSLVGTTAVLGLRQVLAYAANTTGSSSSSPSASASPSPSPSSSASPRASATPKSSSGTGQAVGASAIGAKAASSPKASASPSPSPSASGSPTSSGKLSTTANATGDTSALTPATVKLFNEVNCANKNWQTQIYGEDTVNWDRADVQTVACYQDVKYALAPAVVQGTDLSSVGAQLGGNGQWEVTFGVKEPAASRLGTLTAKMVDATTPQNLLAVVLDGQLQGPPPAVQGTITTSGEISGDTATGGFSQSYANQLADILKYGQLPLSFKNLYTSSVSAQLGSAQLSAGLFAAYVGLLLVVIYSFIYYRGLGIVSVSSLAIAATLSYLSVVLLSKYENFTLSLAGVAGLIVAIGITADSFVVYFERLRDEVREGRSLRAAVERGWHRARRTILVSDTVSFLAALLLYILSIGDVRGFAFTLGLTTLIDILVVFLFTKPMITLLARTKFYGQGHKLSGLDPERLGMRSPWRGSRAPAASSSGAPTTPKEA
jgi:preprotein translocase subunit SecD